MGTRHEQCSCIVQNSYARLKFTDVHTYRQKDKHGQTKNNMPLIIWSGSIQNPQLINIQRYAWKHIEMLLFRQYNKVNPSFWLHLISLVFSSKQKNSKWLKLTTPKGERTKTYLWSRSYRCLLTCFWKLKILEQKSKATFRFIHLTRSGQHKEKRHKQMCAMWYKDGMFGYTIKKVSCMVFNVYCWNKHFWVVVFF